MRGEAGHRVGKRKPRHRGRECRAWDGLGRLNPAIGNEGMHRGKKQRAYVYIVKEKTAIVWFTLPRSLRPQNSYLSRMKNQYGQWVY